jgi:hypothetical protein
VYRTILKQGQGWDHYAFFRRSETLTPAEQQCVMEGLKRFAQGCGISLHGRPARPFGNSHLSRLG